MENEEKLIELDKADLLKNIVDLRVAVGMLKINTIEDDKFSNNKIESCVEAIEKIAVELTKKMI